MTCDPAARCPTFELFLQRVLPDPDVRDFLQRFFGYALTGDVREDLVVVLCGNGQNGKSTLVDAVIEVMGDYGNAVPSTLLVAEGSAERHPTEVATLRGLRLAATFETEGEHRLREALLKQLTGGDRLTARVMRGDFFTFAPTHKLILSTNHRPRVRGTDTAVWRRLRMVPFAVEISEAEQDKDLGTKLRAEQSGILRWLVEGCLKWQRNGLGAPRAVISATNEYRSSEDAVAMFVAEECLPAAEVIVESKLLYGCFRQWFEKSYPGERAPSKTGFGAELRRRGLRSGKSGARRYWIGLQPAAFQPAAVGEVTSWGEREQLPNLVID
ncbi:MAG: phage/plasmid primase, P4 family [Planctomycetota bacterium]